VARLWPIRVIKGVIRPLRMIKRVIRPLRMLAKGKVSGPIHSAVLMNVAVMVRGYVLATGRLGDAVDRSHVNDIYAALFEVTNWLESLSERDAGLNSRGDVQAIKFARNRTHHHWASAVQRQDDEWTWRPLDNLPVPEQPKHRNAKLEPLYVRHLAGRPVVDAFGALEPAVIALAPDVDLN
jgi:hypothetical protein